MNSIDSVRARVFVALVASASTALAVYSLAAPFDYPN